MTNNEIIKGLECMKGVTNNCYSTKVIIEAHNLINRQQAEIKEKQELIDRLHEVNEQLYEEMCERQKEEVHITKKCSILSFAERLKERARPTAEFCEVVLGADIDNLVKEMVGDK